MEGAKLLEFHGVLLGGLLQGFGMQALILLHFDQQSLLLQLMCLGVISPLLLRLRQAELKLLGLGVPLRTHALHVVFLRFDGELGFVKLGDFVAVLQLERVVLGGDPRRVCPQVFLVFEHLLQLLFRVFDLELVVLLPPRPLSLVQAGVLQLRIELGLGLVVLLDHAAEGDDLRLELVALFLDFREFGLHGAWLAFPVFRQLGYPDVQNLDLGLQLLLCYVRGLTTELHLLLVALLQLSDLILVFLLPLLVGFGEVLHAGLLVGHQRANANFGASQSSFGRFVLPREAISLDTMVFQCALHLLVVRATHLLELLLMLRLLGQNPCRKFRHFPVVGLARRFQFPLSLS
mmetsp:Transcript_8804/g.16655  ORF Transcript_8804/g.16655 Transcript_8804/m.16655 type:complete len:347 (-) Transcript_8804:20180-21220(-)